MIEPLCIGTAVMTTALVGARVIFTRRRTGKSDGQGAGDWPCRFPFVRELPRQTVLDHQPSFAEMMDYLEEISPFARDPGRTREFQRCYIAFWNRSLERNLAEIEDGDRMGAESYYYEIDGEDPVCSRHLQQRTYASRGEIHAHPEVIPPFHLGCSCRLRRLSYLSSCRLDTSFHPLFISDNPPILPDWRERAEIREHVLMCG
jgi:hypothetical protein